MITLAEQIAEAQRELALRKRCCPQGVKGGTLKAGDATYQLRAQEAIIRTLMQLDAEQRQLPLFGASHQHTQACYDYQGLLRCGRVAGVDAG